MKSFSFSAQKFISSTRFLAHLFSVLLIFVVVLLTIGETFPNSSNNISRELLLSFSLLTMLVGLLAAWKWEGIGGSLIISGFLLFLILNSVFSDFLHLGFSFCFFLLLESYFYSAVLEKKTKMKLNQNCIKWINSIFTISIID